MFPVPQYIYYRNKSQKSGRVANFLLTLFDSINPVNCTNSTDPIDFINSNDLIDSIKLTQFY